jgi:hypothetical protein
MTTAITLVITMDGLHRSELRSTARFAAPARSTVTTHYGFAVYDNRWRRSKCLYSKKSGDCCESPRGVYTH